jgi:hypothetical protein
MRTAFIIIIVASLVGISFSSNKKNSATISTPKTNSSFAVLELFTSEGCSSCPPADNLLPEFATIDSSVIVLSFHVDYWNRGGWEDPFSNASYSERQKDYADKWKLESVYTPQLIINGAYEMVGSNKTDAINTIKKVLNEKALAQIIIDDVTLSASSYTIKAHLEGDWKNSVVNAAVVQKQASMKVNAGENEGRKLSHTNVVRSFKQENAQKNMSLQLNIPKDVSAENSAIVLYVQRKNDLAIIAAAYHR